MKLRQLLALATVVGACQTPPVAMDSVTDYGTPLLATVGRRGLGKHVSVPTAEDPRVPVDVQSLLGQQYGHMVGLVGEVHQPRTEDDLPPPEMGPKPTTLVRFVHLADTQLVDDESPARQCLFDLPGLSDGAFRPQEGFGCHVLDAAVRAINAIDEVTPIDFVVTGGDNVDGAQKNELGWFASVLAGGPVECDSGADDGDQPGLPFAQKRPFVAAGLQVPWYWVNGNHDVLVTGVAVVDEDQRQKAMGTLPDSGTRDYRLAGAPVTTDPVPSDPARLPLYPTQVVAEVAAMPTGSGPKGHGVATLAAGASRIQYRATPVPNQPVDLIVLDSNAYSGGSDGLVFAAVFEQEIRPLLEASKSAGHYAIVTAHHGSASMGNGGGAFGTTQAGTMTPAEFRRELSKYPGVLFYLAGHSHVNRITRHGVTDGDVVRPLFEVQTASLADWPSQMRLVEVVDADNGFLAARMTAFDTPARIGWLPTNALIDEALALLTMDRASGWNSNPGDGEATDRNVVLWIKKPNQL